jgi:predicted nucleic-acid-binding protein
MRAIDTNLLVRMLVRDNPRQLAAAERFVTPGAWVSHLVLAETLWVLDAVYSRTPAQLATAVELLLSHEHLAIQDADVVEAALERFRYRPSLGFSDCLVLEVARKAGHQPLGTFDRKLARIDGADLVS